MNQEKPTLHESDIQALRDFAIYSAQVLAQKATTLDECHRNVVALEKEFERINQLNGMKAEVQIGYRSIPRKFWHKVDNFVKELEQKQAED